MTKRISRLKRRNVSSGSNSCPTGDRNHGRAAREHRKPASNYLVRVSATGSVSMTWLRQLKGLNPNEDLHLPLLWWSPDLSIVENNGDGLASQADNAPARRPHPFGWRVPTPASVPIAVNGWAAAFAAQPCPRGAFRKGHQCHVKL